MQRDFRAELEEKEAAHHEKRARDQAVAKLQAQEKAPRCRSHWLCCKPVH